jgi:hypothetical protein
MQICTALVLIGGDIGNSVGVNFVTAPEIAVLQAKHGRDAIRNITIKEDKKVDHDEERERLALKYGAETVFSLFGQFGNLPETLKEARIHDDFIEADLTAKRTRKKTEDVVEASGE